MLLTFHELIILQLIQTMKEYYLKLGKDLSAIDLSKFKLDNIEIALP